VAGKFLSDAIAFFTVLSPFKRIRTFLRLTSAGVRHRIAAAGRTSDPDRGGSAPGTIN